MPGARLENITNLSAKGISTLGNKDAVIIWGGANDISKNEVNKGLKHLKNFVNKRQNTNIIVITAPHRHDLQEISCVNKEVEVFNRKLHKIIKTVDNVDLLQIKLSRNDFTCHGLHLNISGKGKIAELIGEHIKNLIRKKEEDPIILEWKENQKKPAQEKNKRKPTKDKKQEPNLIKVRSSKRHRQNPVTRNLDFLWTAD
jgi:alkaline phosphatase